MKYYLFDVYYNKRFIERIKVKAENDNDAYDKAAQKATDNTEIELTEAPVEREKK